MGYSDEENNSEYEMNWDDVGTVIPDNAKVDLVVEKAEYKFRPNSKAHGANFTFLIERVYDDEHEKFVGKKIFENFTFSQNAGFGVKRFARMAELELPTTISQSKIEDWCESAVGAQVGATTKVEKFNEENRTKIKKYWLVGTGDEEQKPKDEDEKEETKSKTTKKKSKKKQEEEEEEKEEEDEETKNEEEEDEEDEEEEEEDEEEEEEEKEDEEEEEDEEDEENEEEEEEEEKPEPKTSTRKKSLREASKTKAAPAKAAASAKKAAGKKK